MQLVDGWREPAPAVTAALAAAAARFERIVLIAHSHGGQVAALALEAAPRDVARRVRLVTVDTPVRRDMAAAYMCCAARPDGRRICDPPRGDGRWLHLRSGAGWEDRMRWLGARAWPWRRMRMVHAAQNWEIRDHSSVLRADRRDFVLWDAVAAFVGMPAGGEAS